MQLGVASVLFCPNGFGKAGTLPGDSGRFPVGGIWITGCCLLRGDCRTA